MVSLHCSFHELVTCFVVSLSNFRSYRFPLTQGILVLTKSPLDASLNAAQWSNASGDSIKLDFLPTPPSSSSSSYSSAKFLSSFKV